MTRIVENGSSLTGKKVLLTGVTGFIGSHIAEELLGRGFDVTAVKRRNSDLWRCEGFADRMSWIDVGSQSFSEIISQFSPDVFIHSAWSGVGAGKRDSWPTQLDNINFAADCMDAVRGSSVKKFISFGSQAEYGVFNGRIAEEHKCAPVSAYGIAKLFVERMICDACVANGIHYFWLRLFSVFGPREGDDWLIPSVARSLFKDEPLDMTKGEQRYDYLYVRDLAKAVSAMIESDGPSGIYNLGSDKSIELRDMLEILKRVAGGGGKLNFGGLPYREGQVMHMEGDSTKFYGAFKFCPDYDLESALSETVRYYSKHYSETASDR